MYRIVVKSAVNKCFLNFYISKIYILTEYLTLFWFAILINKYEPGYLHVHLCVSRTNAQNRHYSIFDKEGLLMREVGIYQRRGEVRENRLLEERL